MTRISIQIRCGLPLALLAMLVAGCGREVARTDAPASDDKVLAVVGEQKVTEADFCRQWERRMPGNDSAAAREQVLEELINRAALLETARREGVDQDPEIAAEIERLMIARLRETKLQPQMQSLSVSDEELKAYYDAHRETKFTEAARVRAAVLWFDAQGQEPLVERFRPRLQAVRDQVLADAAAFPVTGGFGELAIANSEHRASRYKGGDLGWLTESDASFAGSDGWGGAVRAIAKSLSAPGDVSELVERPEGLFMVRLIERRPAEVTDFANVKEQIKKELLAERRKELDERFQTDARAQLAIQRDAAALAALSGLQAGVALTSAVNHVVPGMETQP